MGKQEYLSAGRFAALVGTTKETLFHYDEIGLFVPKRREANGYRYYAMDQMETFDVIGMLRELGMPLAEIRNYLEQRSPEKFGVLLEQEEKVVREKIQRLREMQRWDLGKRSGFWHRHRRNAVRRLKKKIPSVLWGFIPCRCSILSRITASQRIIWQSIRKSESSMLTVGNMEIEVRIMLGLFRNGKHWKRGIFWITVIFI